MASVKRMDLTDLPVQPNPLSTGVRPENKLVQLIRRVDSTWWQPLLVLADACLILLAFVLAYYVRYQLQWFRAVDPASQVTLWDYLPFALALVLLVLAAFRFSGVYPYRYGRSLVEETYVIGTATTLGMVVLIVVSLAVRQVLYSRLIFLYTAILVTLLLGTSRLVIALTLHHLRRYSIGVQRMLLVGVGEVGRMIMRTVAARPDLGYQLVGFVDDNPAKNSTDIGPFKALGEIGNLEQIVETQKVDRVIICLPWQNHRTIQRLLRICERSGVGAQVVPDFFQLTKDQLHVEVINGIPLISTRPVSIQGWNLVFKRIADIYEGGVEVDADGARDVVLQ